MEAPVRFGDKLMFLPCYPELIYDFLNIYILRYTQKHLSKQSILMKTNQNPEHQY